MFGFLNHALVTRQKNKSLIRTLKYLDFIARRGSIIIAGKAFAKVTTGLLYYTKRNSFMIGRPHQLMLNIPTQRQFTMTGW